MWPHSLFAGLLLLALTHHQTHAVHLIADCPAPIPVLDTRLDLPKLAEKEGFLRGAELGVLHGSFSKEVLEVWPSAIEYWLVDLWCAHVPAGSARRPNLWEAVGPQQLPLGIG